MRAGRPRTGSRASRPLCLHYFRFPSSVRGRLARFSFAFSHSSQTKDQSEPRSTWPSTCDLTCRTPIPSLGAAQQEQSLQRTST